MSPQNRLAAALNRISTRTNVIRTRAEDSARAERHGDESERELRLLAVVEHLEQVADQLEMI